MNPTRDWKGTTCCSTVLYVNTMKILQGSLSKLETSPNPELISKNRFDVFKSTLTHIRTPVCDGVEFTGTVYVIFCSCFLIRIRFELIFILWKRLEKKIFLSRHSSLSIACFSRAGRFSRVEWEP